MGRNRLEIRGEMGFGQEEVSTARLSRKVIRAKFRLACEWLTPAPSLRADSMGAEDESPERGVPSSHGQVQQFLSFLGQLWTWGATRGEE